MIIVNYPEVYVVLSHLERLNTFELLGVFNEGMMDYLLIGQFIVCSKLRRYVLRLKKKKKSLKMTDL